MESSQYILTVNSMAGKIGILVIEEILSLTKEFLVTRPTGIVGISGIGGILNLDSIFSQTSIWLE